MKKIIISFVTVTYIAASRPSFEEISNGIRTDTDKHFSMLKELNPLFSPAFQVIPCDSPCRNTQQNNNLSFQILDRDLSRVKDIRSACGQIVVENEGFNKTGLTISAVFVIYKSFLSSSRETTLAYRPKPLSQDSFREPISFPLRIKTQINPHLMQTFQVRGIEIYVNYDMKFDTNFPFWPDERHFFKLIDPAPTLYPKTEIVFGSISPHQAIEVFMYLPAILTPVFLLVAEYAYIASPKLGTNRELAFPFTRISLV